MGPTKPTRYEIMSRRAMLKTSLGTGIFALFPGLACGSGDETIFAGAAAEPITTTSTTEPASTTPAEVEPDVGTSEDTATDELQSQTGVAIDGEMVISFTYTQAAGGKNEWPYVAVWIENAAGDLVETVALWYELGRKGTRWLDHLDRWYDVDLAADEANDSATISSATRAPGTYDVVWDGTVGEIPAAAGDYFICIESTREDGPYSLIREPVLLTGSLTETALPDSDELATATVRIDA